MTGLAVYWMIQFVVVGLALMVQLWLYGDPDRLSRRSGGG
jgi:hypothetical protein